MISEGFVRNGATVFVSSRDAKACEAACKEMNALGKGKADFIAADLYKEDAAAYIATELGKRTTSTFLSLLPSSHAIYGFHGMYCMGGVGGWGRTTK